MALLTRKRYVFGGTLTGNDPDGLPVEYHAGDPVPDEFLDRLTPGEMNLHVREGRLREVGARAAPRAPEAPPTPPTPLEIIKRFSPDASREGDHINAAGLALAGVDFTVVEKPREKDFERALATGTTIPVVIHVAGGQPVATVDLGRLCQLLAARGLAR